jgi:hypothetical protein
VKSYPGVEEAGIPFLGGLNICYEPGVFLNSKTYGLKIKSKHFLIILKELDLARYSRF